ncbi:hypothetical protein [Desulfonatronum thioautotrophicum]|uniref:hypothetical protein n=1 Tax=Desulfonatronum thioautotrophicum TaxID=617001 RepID=UPI0005EBEFAD|nr:hypothetical protein [Desulfonatronum thioautotrophicum]
MTGCSHLDVNHLPRNQLVPDRTEVISLDFWDFQYVAQVEGDQFLIAGQALPNTRVWPGMAVWFQELHISTFLSDAQGVVLASRRTSYPVQRMTSEGVAFSFAIPMETITGESFSVEENVYVTFGYRMRLTETRFQGVPLRGDSFSSDMDVFSAQKGPLIR